MTRFVVMMGLICQIIGYMAETTAGDTLDNELETMKKTIESMSRQIMMQQMSFEERVRSSGDSGIKNVRLNTVATNPYLTPTYASQANSAIHDHSNNIRTVGMGEVIVVLNGVEFRTRHNDYRLYKPNETSTEYNKYQEIEFPGVPPEVKGSVQQQIDEMRLWFKAFKEQNHTVRDYRKYFKPVICYMEGAWTFSDSEKIDEPFDSDRHHIDAISWFDLQDKIRYTSGTGGKSNSENFAFLPTTIASIENNISPKFAQWNYKIMCHPLSRDVPTNRFKIIDDFASRMVLENALPQQEKTRAARFYLNPDDDDIWPENDKAYKSGLLDELMYEIPGKDNYPANIKDIEFGITSFRPSGAALNAGYYHRAFKSNRRGAMGLTLRFRGFNDQNMFVAFNTQNKVMPVSYNTCRFGTCTVHKKTVSYAIPLEIIYMTPLYKWNPYNIIYRGNFRDPGTELVTANNRDGSPKPDKAFDGTHSKLFYQTPLEFFGGGEFGRDAADTAANYRSVLDGQRQMRNVTASGTRIFLPAIGNLGTIRTRYPINPVHDEGTVTRKELEAVKKALLELGHYKYMLREAFDTTGQSCKRDVVIELGLPTTEDFTAHQHTITLTSDDLIDLVVKRIEVTKYTSKNERHQHKVSFRYWSHLKVFVIYKCDGLRFKCWDGHPKEMYLVESD